MTTYTTRTLAEALMPEAAETNIKAATRTLRKFLRDELGNGGAVVGKGSRYSLDYNKRELTALGKKLKAWEIAQEEAKAARAAALAALKPEATETDTEPEGDNDDNADEAAEGPTDEEIAAMLSDEDEADTDA